MTHGAPNRTVRPEAPLPPIEGQTIRSRILFVGLALGLLLTVATGRAVMLQTVNGDVMKREAARNYVRTEVLDDWRGDIADRNGRLLGVTAHRWALTADPTEIREPRVTAALLAPITAMSESDVMLRLDPTSAINPEELQVGHPATRLARQLSSQMVVALGDVFMTPRQGLDMRLDLLEKFMQLEQLQTTAVFPLVDLLAAAAESTATAITGDVEKLRFFPNTGRRFTYIARDLDDNAVKALADARDAEFARCRAARQVREPCRNALTSVWARPEPRRYYPKRDLASQILGLVGRDAQGLSGIERAFNAFLAGGMHTASVIKDQRGRRIFLDGIPADAPLVANTIELTIDQQIQSIAERELARACLASGARAGYAVVVRPKTGEVLAAANFPTYNPNAAQEWFRDQAPLRDERAALQQKRLDLQWASSWRLNAKAHGGQDKATAVGRETFAGLDEAVDAFVEFQHAYPNASRNAAFLDVYEPGSIMKVFTAAAALDAGLVDTDTVFDLENGRWALGDADENVIHDTSRQTEGNLGLILKKSSNIGAAKVAFLLGAQRLEDSLRAFGFGATSGSGFPGEARGLLRPADLWVPVELANVSFGQGMATTGIQLAMALAALGNEGRLMRPLLVKRVVDGRGQTMTSFEPEVIRQAVSPETARTVIELMQTVIEPDGTGKRAYLPEYPVAGKTGTGQKPHLRRRGYSEDMWVNTFFGVAPAADPELAIVVLIDEPKGKQHGGGLIAAPAFRTIMLESLEYLGVASPWASTRKYIWLEPATLAARRALEETPKEDNAKALDALLPTVAAATDGTVPVPDFKGLTMREVHHLASRLALKILLVGTGIATVQDALPGDRVPADRAVTVTFTSRLPTAARSTVGDAATPNTVPIFDPTLGAAVLQSPEVLDGGQP